MSTSQPSCSLSQIQFIYNEKNNFFWLQQEADLEGTKSVNKCIELVTTLASNVGKKIYEVDQPSSSLWENDIRPEYPQFVFNAETSYINV